jgi:lipopolysaccharide export system protein LptA
MLRGARWLLLLAIVAIVAGVASLYRSKQRKQILERPRVSAPLPPNTSATAEEWQYEIKEGDEVKVRVRAKSFSQIKEPSTFLLEHMRMEVRDPKNGRYDLIQSESASFDIAAGTMYSDKDVEITKNLPLDASAPLGRILKIRSSGVSFENKSQRVWTDRKTCFEFDQGGGESVGATYDPGAKELRLHSEAKLEWRGDGKKPPMKVEASQIVWQERASEIYLSAPARLARGTFEMNSQGDAVVILRDGAIERLEAQKTRGADRPEGREIEWVADNLLTHFTEKGEVRQVIASTNAQLTSRTPTGVTTAWADRFDLDFEPGDGESALKKARATGRARVELQPLARAGQPPKPVRNIASEVIELTMRSGGKEIEEVQTHTPAEITFLPARKGDRRRQLNGERIYLYYGPENNLERFRAVNVVTRTETGAEDAKKGVSVTKSRDLEAFFDTKTGQMKQLEQWGDFQYEEGPRRARAAKAVLDNPEELITLRETARVWDDTGSTAADTILLNQKTGEMQANGNVTSTRLPDRKQASGGMVSASEPLQARAQRMTTADRNRLIRYEGDAVLWQGSSRLTADSVAIDRANGRLKAEGSVVSTIPDERGATAPRAQAGKVSVIRAASLDYDDKQKLAYYAGGARLERPGMTVQSREMRIWLREEKKTGGAVETKLDRVFADGKVEIAEKSPDRTRTGQGEHAEYYLDDERVILSGGDPVVADSKRGTSRGSVIRWFARTDKLVVDNSGAGPAVSRIKRQSER